MEPAEKLVRMLAVLACLAGLFAAVTWQAVAKEVYRELLRKREVPFWTETMRLVGDAAKFTAVTISILIVMGALYLFELR